MTPAEQTARLLRAMARPFPRYASSHHAGWQVLLTRPPSPGPEWHFSALWRGKGMPAETELEALVAALGIPVTCDVDMYASGVRHYYWLEPLE